MRLILFALGILFLAVGMSFAQERQETASSWVKAGTARVSLQLSSNANGYGDQFVPGFRYFISDLLFVGGGVRYSSSTITVSRVDTDSTLYGLQVEIGGALPISRYLIGSISAGYNRYHADFVSSGTSTNDSFEGDGGVVTGNLEFFLNPKVSLLFGADYSVGTQTQISSGITGNPRGFELMTGFACYF